MRPLSPGDALTQIHRELKTLTMKRRSGNILLAVTGYVASGKSRFCSALRSDAEVLLQNPLIYLPFDLWINMGRREAARYAERFFLADLIEAVQCIRNGRRFLVPRYDDVIKTVGRMEDASRLSTQELLWNKRPFLRYGARVDVPSIRGATDLYIDPSNGYLYSLFPATTGACFLLDGTLVVPQEVRDLYDVKVFVQAPWPMRVARMIRRFNRKEVFGATKKTMRDYVGFLVAEARECADAEIRMQLDDDIMVVESVPNTLSNYLDLAYLRWLTEQDDAPDWVNQQEVETMMHVYLKNLQEMHDAATIARYQQELIALMESKHLLVLQDADQLLAELSSIIH